MFIPLGTFQLSSCKQGNLQDNNDGGPCNMCLPPKGNNPIPGNASPNEMSSSKCCQLHMYENCHMQLEASLERVGSLELMMGLVPS